MFGFFRKQKQQLTYDHYIQRTKDQRRRPIGYLTVRVRRKSTKEWITLCENKHNLGTTAGEDFLHAQMYTNETAGTRGAGFIAVSSNTVAPAVGDTTLAGEITTGGLARADATSKLHAGGTDATTIEHTFTASDTHNNVQKTALFNAASVGTMPHEATFTATTLNSGDELRVTWTITSTF